MQILQPAFLILHQRIPILPAVSKSHHVPSREDFYIGSVFDLTALSDTIRHPILEWSSVKRMDSVEEELLGCWAPWYVTPMTLPESAMMRPVCALVPPADEALNFTDLLRFIMRNSLVKCLFVCGRWAAGPEGHPRDCNAPKDLLIGAS